MDEDTQIISLINPQIIKLLLFVFSTIYMSSNSTKDNTKKNIFSYIVKCDNSIHASKYLNYTYTITV